MSKKKLLQDLWDRKLYEYEDVDEYLDEIQAMHDNKESFGGCG
jgi:hypothetical protein